MSFDNYDYSGTKESEQYNTLVMLDKAFSKQNKVKPIFHILGGTALLFHGITAVVTIDIDTANRLEEKVKEVVEPFISDNASEVAILPKNYTSRLVPYKNDIFENIKVYILSLEDLAITKLGANRTKDIEDLVKVGLLDRCDYDLMYKIINEELSTHDASRVLITLSKL